MENRQPDSGGHGIRGLDRHDWVQLAEQNVFQLVDQALAVPHLEVHARLWDTGTPVPGATRDVHFFPHILDEAINNLVSTGSIQYVTHQTKGAASADLLIPGDTRLRTTAIAAATRRKAMLYARFMRYSDTFGAAGEAVVRGSLADAMQFGYAPMTPAPLFGEVARVGNADRLPGALDSGAWLLTTSLMTGLPLPAHALLVEVKNRRMTLYPRHNEVHQLLAKAALVQQQHPGLGIVPLLVCRRGHDRLFWMAKDLGFLVHAAKAQFLTLPKNTTEQHVEQLRGELGLTDLKLVTATNPPRIVNLFVATIPKQAVATALRWADVGSQLAPHFDRLRRENLSDSDRSEALAKLRDEAEGLLVAAGVTDPILAWALGEAHDEPEGYDDPF
jgi:hypothetical protein